MHFDSHSGQLFFSFVVLGVLKLFVLHLLLKVIQRSYWESGETTPPMPQKRKKTKKESMDTVNEVHLFCDYIV